MTPLRRVAKLQRQNQPALTDCQVVRLARVGQLIEAHFDRPEDIEWFFILKVVFDELLRTNII